jgi:hypothetical protein
MTIERPQNRPVPSPARHRHRDTCRPSAPRCKGDEGMHKIAARFHVGTDTVQRTKAGMAA